MRIAPALLLTLTMIAAGLPISSFASESASGNAQVVETMRAFYVAVTNDDLAGFRKVVSPDFYVFDIGNRFSADELMAFIKKLHDSGKVFVWQVTEPEVHIDANTAWVTYTNRGSMQDASGKKDLSWLESAVLRKHDGVWRIQFLHATRSAK
jgi:ketosteroid isomerase-like protein